MLLRLAGSHSVLSRIYCELNYLNASYEHNDKAMRYQAQLLDN